MAHSQGLTFLVIGYASEVQKKNLRNAHVKTLWYLLGILYKIYKDFLYHSLNMGGGGGGLLLDPWLGMGVLLRVSNPDPKIHTLCRFLCRNLFRTKEKYTLHCFTQF